MAKKGKWRRILWGRHGRKKDGGGSLINFLAAVIAYEIH